MTKSKILAKIILKYYKGYKMTISKKETTSIKLDKEVKESAKKILKELGLTMGEAVNIFLTQVTLNKGLPFEVKIPNKETQKAIKEARNGVNLEKITLDDLESEFKK